MHRKPKVTIGFCVKNCEDTVKEALVSVVNQDYPHELIEIIVVDGKSNDRTMQIVKEILSSSDIKAKLFLEDKGLGFARQIVLDNATGDIFTEERKVQDPSSTVLVEAYTELKHSSK